MDQDTATPNTSGFGTTTSSERERGVCDHCGQPLGMNRSLEQFLGKIGLNDDVINMLK